MRKFLYTAAAAMLLSSTAGITATATQKCDPSVKLRSGELGGTQRAVGFLLGVNWGVGSVRLDDGRSFKFKVRGLKAGTVGLNEIKMQGTVYNLKDPQDFEGIYGGIEGGVTVLEAGAGFTSMSNQNCVVIEMVTTDSAGLKSSVPFAGGIEIRLAN